MYIKVFCPAIGSSTYYLSAVHNDLNRCVDYLPIYMNKAKIPLKFPILMIQGAGIA